MAASARSSAATASAGPRMATMAAASGSMIRRTSNRLATKAASGSSASCQASTSISCRRHSLRGRTTTVPRCGLAATSPLSASTFIASRTESCEIDSSEASSSELGRVVPGSRPPETMRRPMISAARNGGRAPLIVASSSCTVLPSGPRFMWTSPFLPGRIQLIIFNAGVQTSCVVTVVAAHRRYR